MEWSTDLVALGLLGVGTCLEWTAKGISRTCAALERVPQFTSLADLAKHEEAPPFLAAVSGVVAAQAPFTSELQKEGAVMSRTDTYQEGRTYREGAWHHARRPRSTLTREVPWCLEDGGGPVPRGRGARRGGGGSRAGPAQVPVQEARYAHRLDTALSRGTLEYDNTSPLWEMAAEALLNQTVMGRHIITETILKVGTPLFAVGEVSYAPCSATDFPHALRRGGGHALVLRKPAAPKGDGASVPFILTRESRADVLAEYEASARAVRFAGRVFIAVGAGVVAWRLARWGLRLLKQRSVRWGPSPSAL